MPRRLPADPPVLSGFSQVRPLGAGGFADVFLFQQDMPRRPVAVKVLLRELVGPELLRMFNAEADVMARLSAHPSIVTIYEASVSSDGRPYIAMEFCPGSPAQRFRHERLPVAEVLATGVRIASALETAHRAGVLHRDVKPSNILTTQFGMPVLTDFGIAAVVGSSGTTQVAMSVPWSAPEVVREETLGTIASEVWSLGATIYTLLAGRAPFEGREAGSNTRTQVAERIVRAKYTPISRVEVPHELEQVLVQAMSLNPADRQPTAAAFAVAIQRIQHALGLIPTPLEAPVDEWADLRGPDLDDGQPRGPVRSSVPYVSQRVPRPSADLGMGRPEDGLADDPHPRRGLFSAHARRSRVR